ncbi:Dicer [Hyalella azteca]|uniref:ribonuclease III n=1 Tax=Hyalella azteca TaxID=294128 RepID=A0A6A0H541_HYAAZ|nr:Dicer [Hyalella azteca]
MKKKTAYDRHYLLLCMVFTVLTRIRIVIEDCFSEFSELDQILQFSTPKVLRLISILRRIRPIHFVDPRNRNKQSTEESGPDASAGGSDNQNLPKEEVCRSCGRMLADPDDVNVSMTPVNPGSHSVVVETKLENYNLDHIVPDASITEVTDDDIKRLQKQGWFNECDEGQKNTGVSLDLPDGCDFKPDACDSSQGVEYSTNDHDVNDGQMNVNLKNLMNKHVKFRDVDLESVSSFQSCSDLPSNSSLEEGKSQLSPKINGFRPDEDLCNMCDDLKINDSENCDCCDDGELKLTRQVLIEGCDVPSLSVDGLVQHGADSLCAAAHSDTKTQPKTAFATGFNQAAGSHNAKFHITASKSQVNGVVTSAFPTQGRGGKKRRAEMEVKEKVKVHNPDDPDSVCGLVFVRSSTTAKMLYRLFKELSDIGGDFAWIFPQFTVEVGSDWKSNGTIPDEKTLENERKKQEEVLRRFRHLECNMLVATRVLEEGIDVPNCTLVVRFDPALSFQSYVQSCGRARSSPWSHLFHLADADAADNLVSHLATYCTYKKRDCQHMYCAKLPSDTFTRLTVQWQIHTKPSATQDNPPAPQESTAFNESSSGINAVTSDQDQNLVTATDGILYCCSLALPINSPLKDIIVGPWQPSPVLAKHCAAFTACVALHQLGELDDQLLPVGKESIQLDQHLCPPPPSDLDPDTFPRPGTTKRRQYYYKKVAACLTKGATLGEVETTAIQSKETVKFASEVEANMSTLNPEQTVVEKSENTDATVNTRGRRIYRPELSPRDFGILTTEHIPQTSAFPVFTRSGEVLVNLNLISTSVECDALKLTDEQLKQLNMFHQFTFSHVLRLEKYPIKFDPLKANASYFVVPLIRVPGKTSVDWQFVESIGKAGDLKPSAPSDEDRRNFTFKKELYEDAVVMPWYRNHDQPQYFYVAEICEHLNPQSDFPDAGFETFEKYYWTKYGLQVSNLRQPLLDVDHTSARLNLLTPRHVNRKGVALPTTSEETKRAKRESLQQKQILVPELCSIHPFPASLWRKAVCLPTVLYSLSVAQGCVSTDRSVQVCMLFTLTSNIIVPFPASLLRKAVCLPTVLYRINALLLADELRVIVAQEIGLGRPTLPPDHVWPALDFGWTLADVFKKTSEGDECGQKPPIGVAELHDLAQEKVRPRGSTKSEDDELSLIDEEYEKKKGRRRRHGELEIGTWSNEMALAEQEMAADAEDEDLDELEVFDPNEDLPDNLTILDCGVAEDDIEGELGADWGTGLKERKAKARTGVSSTRKKTAAKATSRPRDSDAYVDNDGNGSTGIFRVGSPSNFEYDDNFDFNDNCYKGDKFSGGEGADSYSNYDEDDDDFDDYWDDYEASSDEESVTEEIKSAAAANDWSTKPKKRHEDEEQHNDQDELDLFMGEINPQEIAEAETEFCKVIEDKKLEMLHSDSFVGENDELLFEKAKRKNLAESNIPPAALGSLVENFDVSCAEYNEEIDIDEADESFVIGSDVNLLPPCTKSINTKASDTNFGLDYSSLNQSATLENMMVSHVKKESTLYPVGEDKQLFSFDFQPDLSGLYGPSPSVILQALTMSNANDGVNLERLETIGDSYLKYAITTYLYCMFPQQHEGKLSYLRSKQVSNLNLYRLGKYKGLGDCMVATKFEPHDNWLPPSYYVPRELEEALIASGIPSGHWNMAELPNLHELSSEQIRLMVLDRTRLLKNADASDEAVSHFWPPGSDKVDMRRPEELPIFIPYNLLTQHSIPDKSIADSVEALIGAYLTTCGPKGALLFMSWLGIKVLPTKSSFDEASGREKFTFSQVGLPASPLHVPQLITPANLSYTCWTTNEARKDVQSCQLDSQTQICSLNAECSTDAVNTSANFSADEMAKPPLFGCSSQDRYPVQLFDHYRDLDLLLTDYDEFERTINYTFIDRAYLLQAFTHASFCRNRLTDCYQRLEFLGDAVLDYLITRHLYEDCRHHSPGALTDLRSALVNNTIFATLAVKHSFHKYFRHFSPGLDSVIRDFVKDQEANEHKINEEYYLLEGETEADIVEDIEVPKALGDVFESVAGAIFLDSGCSLDAVWGSYYPIMKAAIDQFTAVVPKSPIRELLEMEPETAKFGRPERLVDGKVRVSVEIFGKGSFCGVGRNYRIAKSTAAKRALRHLRHNQLPACVTSP